MLEFENKLLDNLERFRQHEDYVADVDCDEDGFFRMLNERVRQCLEIYRENSDIMENKLRPLLYDVHGMNSEVADAFIHLANKLYSHSKSLDEGLSLEILEKVTLWARAAGDSNRLIKCLYYTGIIYQHLNDRLSRHGVEAFRKKCYECFSEAASYINEYFDIDCSETRGFINRCMGNLYVITRKLNLTELEAIKKNMRMFLFRVERALNFWQDERVRALDPDMPWESFIINAHQNTSNWLWMLSRNKYRFDDMDLIKKACESCDFLLRHESNITKSAFWNRHRTDYIKNATKYCLGEISYDEMLECVRDMYYLADKLDYSDDGLYFNLSTPIDILLFFKPSDLDKDEVKSEIKHIVEKMYSYCKGFPQGANKTLFKRYVGTACKTMVGVLGFEDSIELILSLTVYTHPPTYVHSMMVRGLSEIIAGHILASNPGYFEGLFGTSDSCHVEKKSDDILQLIGQASICHDMGKVLYLEKVAISSRKLYDFEFEIIKSHSNSSSFINAAGDRMQLIADIIGGHHMWCDNTKGYGEKSMAGGSKSLINIITVADSIDAATDGIGRYYSRVLTLEEVLSEIHEQAGSRYCKTVSEVLKNPAIVEEISKYITHGRKKAFFLAYKR